MRPLFALPLLLLLACATTPKPVPDYGSGSGVSVSPRGASLVSLLEGQAMAPVGSPSWLGQAYSLTLNAPSGSMAVRIPSGAWLYLDGASTRGIRWDGTQFAFAGGIGTSAITSSAGSGSNAVSISTNGARIDFGSGASDYASSDGTTVTFAGPLATATTFGATTITGTSFTATARTLSTCGAGLEGFEQRDSTGGSAGVFTKLCMCRYDGTTYRWYNVFNPSATTGTTTTCPN